MWGWLGRNRHWFWVVFDKSVWVAYAALSVYDGKTLYFGPTFVKPEYRGRGIQLRLLRLREEFARGWGAEKVVTVTEADNQFSINNILRAGFTESPPWPGSGGRCFEKLLSH